MNDRDRARRPQSDRDAQSAANLDNIIHAEAERKDVLPREVKRNQLVKVLESRTFKGAGQLSWLLGYLGEQTLAGKADDLKEYSLAEAQGLTDYDPTTQSNVRKQIERLRQKLEDYRMNEGRLDDVIIDLPKKQYALTFERRERAVAAGAEAVTFKMVLTGTINARDKDRIEAIVEHLRHMSGDVLLTLVRCESGSVVLVLKCSRDAFRRLEVQYDAGLLPDVLGLTVQTLELLDDIPANEFINNEISTLLEAVAGGNLDEVQLDRARQLGAEATPYLVQALRSPLRRIQRAAAEVLLRMNRSASSLFDLNAALQYGDENTRSAAAAALGSVARAGAVATQKLLSAALPENSVPVREAAMRALGSVGDETAVRGLAGVLQDTSAEIRKTAAAILGETRNAALYPVVTDALIGALIDPDRDVRIASAAALGSLIQPRYYPANPPPLELVDAVIAKLAEALADSDAGVRLEAVRALIPIAETAKWNEDERISVMYSWAYRMKTWDRNEVAEELSRRSNASHRAVVALMRALEDESAAVRESAADVLVRVGSAAVGGLTLELESAEKETRALAARILGQIGKDARNAIGRLEYVLKDENEEEVRASIADALDRIRSAERPL